MKIRESFVFNDVLLVPKYSDIKSRKDVDLSVDLGKKVELKIPVVSANMRDICGIEMAQSLSKLGGLPIIHRFFDYDQIPSIFTEASRNSAIVGASIGIQEKDKNLAAALVDVGCKIICIDVAHGHSKDTGVMTSWIAKNYPEVLLISGNVATREGALFLYDNGADVVKCGIGGGSTCLTRINAGAGVGQLTALEDCYSASVKCDGSRKFKIIADGGISKPGDLCKALVFSDVVMLGNLLAGTNEAPGEMIELDGSKYKKYVGSSTLKSNYKEGVEALVPCKGPVESVITDLMQGLQSGMAYQGCKNLVELKEDPEFVLISNAGFIESGAHDVKVVK